MSLWHLPGHFLSTSSLGDRRWIGDFAFTPTMKGGLGVTYFLTDNHKGFLYCLSYHKDQADDIPLFIDGLHEGVQRLMAVFKNK